MSPRLRHVSQRDLDELDGLLLALRAIPALRERKRGSFSKGSRAFLHFHAGENAFYADVRLEEAFERMPVTTDEERAAFLARVRASV